MRGKTKVKTEILEWWKPKIGDLYTFNNAKDIKNAVYCCNTKYNIEIVTERKGLTISAAIPLLTEEQLREYIEYKNKLVVSITPLSKYSYQISLLDTQTYTVISTSVCDKEQNVIDMLWEYINLI